MNKIKSYLRKVLSIFPIEIFETRESRAYAKVIEEYQEWNGAEISEFQRRELIKLINHAYNNVPFYKELYDAKSIDINKIKSLDDIKKLPIITKEDVKNNVEKFIALNISRGDMRETHTGGTTSTPMRFYNTKETDEREKAIYNWIWNKYGYKGSGKEKCLILRGNYRTDCSLYEYDSFNKNVIVNPSNMDDKRIEMIISLIEEKNIRVIQAYPSLIYLVAKYINRNDLKSKVSKVDLIFCSSEKIYKFQRDELIKAFGCKVIDYYGHNERTTLLYSSGGNYKDIPIYGITEILNGEGKEVSKGERGYIVGTSINNYAFPLIRYNTKDSVVLLDKINNHLIIEDIDGRAGDFVVTKSGKRFSPTILEFAIDNINNFKDIQLVQESYDLVNILIVPDSNYEESDGEGFRMELERIVGNEIIFQVKIVDIIDKPKNSKSRFVYSKIKE